MWFCIRQKKSSNIEIINIREAWLIIINYVNLIYLKYSILRVRYVRNFLLTSINFESLYASNITYYTIINLTNQLHIAYDKWKQFHKPAIYLKFHKKKTDKLSSSKYNKKNQVGWKII